MFCCENACRIESILGGLSRNIRLSIRTSVGLLEPRCFVGDHMSSELKNMLTKVAQEDCERAEEALQAGMGRFESLLLKIAQSKKLDVLIWFEGTTQEELNRDEADLSMLERANLIKGQIKYTHRNAYRQYELTKKGAELAERLSQAK